MIMRNNLFFTRDRFVLASAFLAAGLLPLALAYILVTAGAIWGLDRGLGWSTPRAQAFGLLGLNAVLGWLLVFVLDRGRVVRGVSAPIRPVRSRPVTSERWAGE